MPKTILTTESAKHFGLTSGKADFGRFPGGEISLRIDENVAGADTFIVGSINAPAENLVELLLAIDTANRLSAKSITAIIPFFAYARADREKFPGEAVSAGAVVKMLEAVGGEHFKVISVDIHSSRASSFFKVPFENLDVTNVFIEPIKELGELTLVAPDNGAEAKMMEFSEKLGINKISVLQKVRRQDGSVEIRGITGDVGKRILMVDDIIDSGGTIMEASKFLKNQGAEEMYVAATHMVWPGGGYQKLVESDLLKKIYTTDTLAPPPEVPDKIQIISVSPMLQKIVLS